MDDRTGQPAPHAILHGSATIPPYAAGHDAGHVAALLSGLDVGGGRILAVGSNIDIRAHAGPGTHEVMLRGRSLLPGFINAHCHPTGLGMAMASIDCNAPGMQSIEALQKAVYERAATQPPGTWIRGRGYDQTRLREGRHPTRDDWDVVSRVNTKRDGLW